MHSFYQVFIPVEPEAAALLTAPSRPGASSSDLGREVDHRHTIAGHLICDDQRPFCGCFLCYYCQPRVNLRADEQRGCLNLIGCLCEFAEKVD